jgi:hydroxyacylglutathione hydrolase
MQIRQIYADNPYRNFHYLIACEATGEALVIDPLDAERCLKAARQEGWRITQVLNTHEHMDHIGGNGAVIAATGAKLLAHHAAQGKIPGVDIGLKAGDIVKVGNTVRLKVLDTPGHTMSHICLLSLGDDPALFCGDTMFNAGVGNCKNGGHPEALYDTFRNQLDKLPDNTRIFPGHDYIANNLAFTLDREPDNEAAKKMTKAIEGQDPHHARITTLGEERKINSFFRLQSPSVIAALRLKYPDLPEHPSEREVFLALRELRNHW